MPELSTSSLEQIRSLSFGVYFCPASNPRWECLPRDACVHAASKVSLLPHEAAARTRFAFLSEPLGLRFGGRFPTVDANKPSRSLKCHLNVNLMLFLLFVGLQSCHV